MMAELAIERDAGNIQLAGPHIGVAAAQQL